MPRVPLLHFVGLPFQRRPQIAVAPVPEIRDFPAGDHAAGLAAHEDRVDRGHGDAGDQLARNGPLVGLHGLLRPRLQLLQLLRRQRRQARLDDLPGFVGDGVGGLGGGHGEDGVELHGGLGEELGEELRPGLRGGRGLQ